MAPLKQLADDLWIMELFHGPTLAFKEPKEPLDYLKRLEFHRAAHGPADYGLD